MLEWTPTTQNLVIVLIILWSLPWKGVALWKASRNYHVAWFIVLLLLNTLGILEIFYIYVISKKTPNAQ